METKKHRSSYTIPDIKLDLKGSKLNAVRKRDMGNKYQNNFNFFISS